MPRRKRVLKRPVLQPDQVFGSDLVSMLINRVMYDGKKTVATKIVVEAIKKSAEIIGAEPVDVATKAITNVQPEIEVKSVRVGGASYQVPMEPPIARKRRLALTWIVNSARSLKGKPMYLRLSQVLTDSYNNEGPAIAKKLSVQQTAAGNKAFAHFAFRMKKKK